MQIRFMMSRFKVKQIVVHIINAYKLYLFTSLTMLKLKVVFEYLHQVHRVLWKNSSVNFNCILTRN